MIPSAISNYAAQGIAYLTGKYGQQANIVGLLKARMTSTQELEGVFNGILNLRMLANATGAQVDLNGALVGQPRNGMTDADYKTAIALRSAVNRAVGRMTDWASLAKILLTVAVGPVAYYEGTRTDFVFAVWNCPLSQTIVASILADAVPNGVRATFASSTWADGNDFEWCDDSNPSTTGQGTWGDDGSGGNPATGGLWISDLGMT